MRRLGNLVKFVVAAVVAVIIVTTGANVVTPVSAGAVTPGAITFTGFVPVDGTAESYKIKPGQSRNITVYADFINDNVAITPVFHSFSLSSETEESALTFSNLKITDSSEYSACPVDKEYLYSYLGGRYRIEFTVTCGTQLEVGDYTIVLSGATHLNKLGREVFKPDSNDSSGNNKPSSTRVLSLLKFTLSNKDNPKTPTATIDSITYNKSNFAAGTNQEFSIKVTNTSTVDIAELYVEAGLDMEDIFPAYDMLLLRGGELKAGSSKTIKVPVTVASTAKSGMKSVTFTVTGNDKYGNPINDLSETLFVTIGKAGAVTDPGAPNVTITTKQNYRTLQPGTEDSVKLKLTNNGKAKAQKVKLFAKGGFGVLEGLTKNFTSDYLEVKDIEPGKTVTVEVPFTVTNSFSKGIHELSFEVSFVDEEKKSYTSETMTMYVEHYLTDSAPADDTVRTYIQISNVKQSPSIPTAGDKVSVTFAVKNKGNAAISNLLFYGTNLSSAGFEPISSEPYQNEGTLGVDESKTITMNFRAGEDIPKGVNSLNIGYEFQDANYEIHTGSTTVYILNVSNSKFDDIDVGRPKIIVSDYTTDPEEIKAGSIFDFSYTLKNTHQAKAAKNIKITLSQDEGVFSPAEGTNIFYIEMMEPGEESVLTLPLKAKGDTATGDYGVKLLLEYEYDDMSSVDKEHGGVSEENIIKIHAVENYRPEIENIYIDSYNGVMVGQPVDLSFEFYNMGKSTLGNVYITVEGDFELANNSAMSYVGAVSGYGQEYLCPQVVPLVSGEAYGTVTIHFEDSNGDEQTKSAEFTAWVDEEYGFEDWDPSFEDWDPSFDDWDDPLMEEEGFFASIPWWGYVIAGVVVAGGITVLVIVLVKKSKKRKLAQEEEDDDEDI